MRLWLDDVREPWKHGFIMCEWVRTADEAIERLKQGDITLASLDHDLAPEHYEPIVHHSSHHVSPQDGSCMECWDQYERHRSIAKTGYDVICWMEANNVWPKDGTFVHSMNPVGRQRMQTVIDRHYRPGNEVRCRECHAVYTAVPQHKMDCSRRGNDQTR